MVDLEQIGFQSGMLGHGSFPVMLGGVRIGFFLEHFLIAWKVVS